MLAVELLQSLWSCNLRQLGAQVVNLDAELDADARVEGLTRQQEPLRLVQRNECVLDVARQLLFVWDLPCLEWSRSRK